nr:MAG: YraN family protein [Candidatus Omnitrophota bacterium]
MSKESLNLGKAAEERAVGVLKESGYKILFRNYRNKLGEIDVIALDRDTICFVEVKSKKSIRFGLPQEALARVKQRKILRVALSFLKENNLLEKKARFDVVALEFYQDKEKPKLIKGAFQVEESYAF